MSRMQYSGDGKFLDLRRLVTISSDLLLVNGRTVIVTRNHKNYHLRAEIMNKP